MSEGVRQLNNRHIQRHNQESAMRLRGRDPRRDRNRNRSRSRSRNRCSQSSAHQGRDLRVVNAALIRKRIEQYPNESFAYLSDRLRCQACNKAMNVKASTVKRHLGLDENQAVNTNAEVGHRQNLERWRNRDQQERDESQMDIKQVWLKSAMIVGMNGTMTLQFA